MRFAHAREIEDRLDITLHEVEGIVLRRTYTREVKSLKLKVRFMNHPTRMKEGRKAVKRLRTIARAMVSAIAFEGSPYDGHTLGAHLEQIVRLTGHTPKEAVTDRGYRGKKKVSETEISIPTGGISGQSYYQKQKARKKFRKRAGIEPVIGHLKSDHRMMRNYLRGTRGDAINTMMAAVAYNMRHWMNKNASFPVSSFVFRLKMLFRRLENMLFENENQYACWRSSLALVV